MGAIFIALLLTLPAAVWAADKIQPLDIKPGLWETTATVTTGGARPIPDEVLSWLTPEQRAAMEARMKGNSGGKTTTNTYKRCMSKEDMQKAPKFVRNDKCTMTVLTSTSSKAEVGMVCDAPGMKGDGTMHVEALNPETVKGSGQTTLTGNGHTMNVNSNFTSKWLGAACGNAGE